MVLHRPVELAGKTAEVRTRPNLSGLLTTQELAQRKKSRIDNLVEKFGFVFGGKTILGSNQACRQHFRERYVNRILRKVLVMERQAEAGGVQLKAAVGSTTITNRVSSISVRSVIHEPGVNSS